MALPLKGDQSYVSRVNIESVRPVGPVNVKKLLTSNMTLDQVRNEIWQREEMQHSGDISGLVRAPTG